MMNYIKVAIADPKLELLPPENPLPVVSSQE